MSLKQNLQKMMAPRPGEHRFDGGVFYLSLAIVVFGLVMLSSATAAVAYTKTGDSFFYLKRQLISVIIGFISLWFFSKVDYRYWKKYAGGFLIFSIFMLILVFIPGLSAHYGKARSWINIFGYSLQPSELVKFSFLLYLAAWLENKNKQMKDFSESIKPFVIVLGAIGFLMLLQPDFGTLSIIAATSFAVYFVAGGNLKQILAILFVGILLFALMVSVKEYQRDRIRCLIDPAYSAQDKCYQINQSLIAVGSGGLFGRGFGQSRQKYFYVPEVQGDSIFSIISEEMGMAVCLLLIGAYLGLFFRGLKISRAAPDNFGKYLAVGIVSWLTIQALVNIGGIINLMPMTGVPLPLVSQGGTSILAALSAIGLLLNISKQTKELRAYK